MDNPSANEDAGERGGAPAFRPMQYDCDKSGCFNRVHRLDFGRYYDSLPGKISFSDIDAITEIAGNFLVIEWKTNVGELNKGQHLLFSRMTKSDAFTVFVMAGPKDNPTHGRIVRKGLITNWLLASDEELQFGIRAWSRWALANPKFR